jgi:hypothetical protein
MKGPFGSEWGTKERDDLQLSFDFVPFRGRAVGVQLQTLTSDACGMVPAFHVGEWDTFPNIAPMDGPPLYLTKNWMGDVIITTPPEFQGFV